MSNKQLYSETKFAYKHIPTGHWVVFDRFVHAEPHLCLIKHFIPETLYRARNIIEEDFDNSVIHSSLITHKDKQEFELVEVEVFYNLK